MRINIESPFPPQSRTAVLAQKTILLALFSLLSGCALLDDAQHPSAAGWRSGYVRQIGMAEELGDRKREDCRATDERANQGPYVLVAYPYHRSRRYAILPTSPDAEAPALGETVWFQLGTCRPAAKK